MNHIRMKLCVSMALILSLTLTACGEPSSKSSSSAVISDASEAEKMSVVSRFSMSFSSDSAFAMVVRQCEFGSRVPGSEAHRRCADFLLDELHRVCDTTFFQNFTAEFYDGTSQPCRNIIGMINPDAQRRMALFAHWDSRPFADNDNQSNWHQPILGANDGASGVAVLLEVARQFERLRKEQRMKEENDSMTEFGVDFIFLDAEDYGTPSFETREKEDTWCLGAQYWSAHPTYKKQPEWGILLDMVGGDTPFFGFDQVSAYFAQKRLLQVWNTADELGYGKSFVKMNSGSVVDDHYYINLRANIPTVDIIDFQSERGFPSSWHTLSDTPENISKTTLQMVGETILQVLEDESRK